MKDRRPYDRLAGESREEWQRRLWADWPETALTLRIIGMVDENHAARREAAS